MPVKGEGKQVPFAAAPAATEHASQGPAHALSQHTPSEQKPLAQSPADAHAEPVAEALQIST